MALLLQRVVIAVGTYFDAIAVIVQFACIKNGGWKQLTKAGSEKNAAPRGCDLPTRNTGWQQAAAGTML